jgi:hypothetical protein
MALCAALLAFGLAGCETYQSLTSSLFSSSSDTPTASVTPPAAPAVRQAQVAIAPIIGPPEAVSKDLQAQITSDLERQNIRVAKSPGEPSQYTLRGYIVSSMEKKGGKAKVSYIWDVTDGTGKGVHRVSGEETASTGKSKDPWTAVSATVVQSISSKTATSLSTWLPTQGTGAIASNNTPPSGLVQNAAATQSPAPTYASTAPPATASLGKPGSITARVPGVTGAPGDGSSTLRSALQKELARSGVALADTPSPSTYTVEGKVAMGASKDGKQSITIDWNVTDPEGKKLGTVSQKNDVPQGSLDGAWGKTADAAAAAAAQGILKLLPQAQKTSFN